jgi:hypothetical protein
MLAGSAPSSWSGRAPEAGYSLFRRTGNPVRLKRDRKGCLAVDDQNDPVVRPYMVGSSFGPVADQTTRSGIGF